jgi:VTC domain-containing protein
MSAHVTLVRPSDRDEDAGIIEQKFLFDGFKSALLLDWLEFHAVRDREFYFSPILSLYYDTPELRFYQEVCNGDYLKTKVRLRWYQRQFPAEQETVDCFLEIKGKSGARRYKRRQQLALGASSLTGDLFSRNAILGVPEALPEIRLVAGGILVPVLIVEYERFRFFDPRSGSRIALDVGIGCRRANAAYLPGVPPVRLGSGVLEVKGALDTLPEWLRPIQGHLRKQSFSKYAHCCGLLIDPFRTGASYE